MPALRLPDLPIVEALPRLLAALAAGRSAVVQAPPGAGKSTIVPLALLEGSSGWLGNAKILMLEPRRLAARAVAMRMAQLLGEAPGGRVGFRTRLETQVGRGTRIEVVTEGILTRMLQDDPALEGIGCVIFDEFHERSLNADLGLALCIESREALREELRLVVMSATLEAAPIARLLGDAPIIESHGRTFEVTTEYVPARPEVSAELHVAQVARRALREREGDILCFLPGTAEIRRVQRTLEEPGLPPGTRVLPLYGELDVAAQDAALTPSAPGARKIVLSTSIAETSLTIEGIRVVVDGGLRRYSAFDPASGMSRLVTGKVSQAAADQRRGRAGRLSSGHCYRLWSQGAQASLSPQTPPEIVHADLAPLALELACWGAADPDSLAWLNPPPAAPLAQARDLLQRLEAIDHVHRATPHGRRLSQVGAHPRLAHLLVRGREQGVARLAAELAALLSERDVVRSVPGGARDADLRLRVAALRGDRRELPSGLSVDAATLSRVQRTAGLWQREAVDRRARADDGARSHEPRSGSGGRGAAAGSQRVGPRDASSPQGGGGADIDGWTGILLGFAYPDRIARARGESGRFLLANGRGARFGEPQPLSRAELLVAAELDGAEREARIFLAAPLDRADLEKHFGAQIVDTEEIVWDERDQAVRARRQRRLGALILESGDLPRPDADAVLDAALSGLEKLGIEALPWTPALRQWQARVLLMRQLEVPAPDPWPDLSDAALTATLREWAPPWMQGITRREHFARLDLGNALRSRLSYAQGAVLEREAPTHFTVPSGSSIPIDYLDGEIPTLSVRLQEMFGLRETPTIGAGRMALLLKLLSPARRPVQITRDLISFWNRGYHEVKKDLKGRYPKHYWPEDPYAAEPTRRVRPPSSR